MGAKMEIQDGKVVKVVPALQGWLQAPEFEGPIGLKCLHKYLTNEKVEYTCPRVPREHSLLHLYTHLLEQVL